MMKLWRKIIIVSAASIVFQLAESFPTDSSSWTSSSNDSTFGLNHSAELQPLDYNENYHLIKNNIDLTARHNILLGFEKHFVQLSREAVKVILADLKALPEQNDVSKKHITALSNALVKIEDINLVNEPRDKRDVRRVSNIIGDLIHSNISIAYGAAKHEKLAFEMQKLTDCFGVVFDDFIATLTPKERQMDVELVALHPHYNESNSERKWDVVLADVWNYFVA